MLSYYCGLFLKTGAFGASAMRFGDIQEIENLESGAAKNHELKLGCYQDQLEDFETTQT